jgi:hypothetical protein
VITLLTGQPGHGKTLRALELAMAERAKGRAVYACRVRGLDAEKTGFIELESLADWQGLPDGSVVLVDECYEDIPARGPGKAGPDWETALATHRHRGFDFILICQLGSQISTFVRGLVNEHTHVRRKFGFERSTLLTWDRYQSAVASNAEVRMARKRAWKYPREIFELYKSAEVHTVQRSIPWQVYAIPLLLAFVVFCFWSVFHRFAERAEQKKADAAVATAAQGAAPAATAAVAAQAPGREEKAPLTPEEWLREWQPRVAGMPWSAPWHDGAKPQVDPDIYCMDVEGAECRCYTEQVTRLLVAQAECRVIARYGIYNPFREPPRSRNTNYPAERPTGVDRDGSADREVSRRVASAGAHQTVGPRYQPIDPASEEKANW